MENLKRTFVHFSRGGFFVKLNSLEIFTQKGGLWIVWL
jgi:hypothetical protein